MFRSLADKCIADIIDECDLKVLSSFLVGATPEEIVKMQIDILFYVRGRRILEEIERSVKLTMRPSLFDVLMNADKRFMYSDYARGLRQFR